MRTALAAKPTKTSMAKSVKKPVKSPAPLLQKWQRNSIFESIQSFGLDPRDFDMERVQAETRIKHKLSASFFVVGGSASHYSLRNVVGDGVEWPSEAYSWGTVVHRIQTWLEEVKRDVAMPDLWAELQRETELFRAYSDGVIENTPFTPIEQKEIASRLQEMVDRARRVGSLSMEQLQVLNTKVDYLTRAAGRLGRIDWRNAFAGSILAYLLTMTLPPESARDIVVQLFLAIGHFYGLRELPAH
jgi:hypothetical protein